MVHDDGTPVESASHGGGYGPPPRRIIQLVMGPKYLTALTNRGEIFERREDGCWYGVAGIPKHL